jgi:PKD repeat protein
MCGQAATNTPVAVLTQHNDNARTGMNLVETILNTNNVNTNQFGLTFTRPVDDQIYAQPLLMTNVSLPGKGSHNLIIIATVNDSVYSYDADDASVTAPYWTASFINPPNIVAPRNTDMTGACGGNYKDFSGNMGIVGAPVIDPVTRTLYLVARTREFGTTYVQRLHALDLATGLERSNSPVVIASFNGVAFDPYKQNQRSGLLLANGYVYITWASHCDWAPYHGWVIGYNVSNLLQAPISFNATPSGSMAGVWMSNQGPVADTNGNVYISTGNGTFDGFSNFGESFLKLTRSGGILGLSSWFAPFNWSSLNASDADLGSGGILLIPGTSLLLSGGKGGVLYLVNKDNMGGVSLGTSDTNIVQSWSLGSHQIHGGPAWWDAPDGSYAYVWAASADHLRQYKFDRVTGRFLTTTPYAQSVTVGGNGQPGAILALSANGSIAGSGIIWAAINTTSSANQAVVAGTLHAYSAQNVANELWNSDMVSSRDALGTFAKFVAPTVANGKVYMATFSNRLNVYGLLVSNAPALLSISPTNLNFGSMIAGQVSNKIFQVINKGGQTLTGTATSSTPYSISSGNPFTVTPGQTGLVQVTYGPTTGGNFSNVVVFASNGGKSTNTVLGSALTPGLLAVTPASLNYGTLAVGTTMQAVFVVTNKGGLAITNGTASVTGGPFAVVSGIPFTIPGFGSSNVVVRFAPVTAGSFSNAAVFASSGGGSTNPVIGSALTPGLLAVTPASLNYGTVVVGTTTQAVFVVTNKGGLAITNGTASVTGGPFAVVSGTPFTVPGFGSSNVMVRFAPVTAGSFSNAAVFASSGGGSTNALAGVGAVVPVAHFSGNPTHGAAPLLVNFNDSSTGTITNRFWTFGDGANTNTMVTNLTHRYGVAGTNSVSLTVSGPIGTNTVAMPNYIIVTNIGPVKMTIEVSGAQVQLAWPSGALQSAVVPTGPYTNIVGAVSPYKVAPSGGTRYFRVQVQ